MTGGEGTYAHATLKLVHYPAMSALGHGPLSAITGREGPKCVQWRDIRRKAQQRERCAESCRSTRVDRRGQAGPIADL